MAGHDARNLDVCRISNLPLKWSCNLPACEQPLSGTQHRVGVHMGWSLWVPRAGFEKVAAPSALENKIDQGHKEVGAAC